MNIAKLLHSDADSTAMQAAFASLNTLSRPALDEEDDFSHYDWIMVRRKGIELGFVDTAYHRGVMRALWRTEGLMLSQITYYNDTRDGVLPFTGELPHLLNFSDTRETVRQKLAAFDATRHSYLTDRWDTDSYRLVVAYKPNDRGLDNVHLKLPTQPLDERVRLQPAPIGAADWVSLFGSAANAQALTARLAPLDIPERIEDEDDEREVDFLEECGLTLYFEEMRRLKLPEDTSAKLAKRGSVLVLGGVKFYRARDLESRQYTGELPFDLRFDDSPELLFQKVKFPPQKKSDGLVTGHALWHFRRFSLHVLYSTVENHLFRVMLMAPGYWHEMAEIEV